MHLQADIRIRPIFRGPTLQPLHKKKPLGRNHRLLRGFSQMAYDNLICGSSACGSAISIPVGSVSVRKIVAAGNKSYFNIMFKSRLI
jgi:hypothetical protein